MTSPTIVHKSTPCKNPQQHPQLKGQKSKLNNGRKITPISCRSTSSGFSVGKFVKVALLTCLLFPVAGALSWDCPTPQGSYLDKCDRPVGIPYQSTDPYLRDVKFCRYTVSCKKANQDIRTTQKVLPREELACAKNWENCNGFLIGREGDERLCSDTEKIKAELRLYGLLNEKEEL